MAYSSFIHSIILASYLLHAYFYTAGERDLYPEEHTKRQIDLDDDRMIVTPNARSGSSSMARE